MMNLSNKHDYYRTDYPRIWQRNSRVYGQAPERARYYEHFLRSIDGQPGDRILDCGVGTGVPLALQLAQQGCRMAGIDLSDALLTECRRNFDQEGESIEMVQGGLEELPFRDDSFDKVYASSVIWRVEDVAAALREMRRVTRRGGSIVFDTLNPFHITPFASNVYHRALIRFWNKPKALAHVLLPPRKWRQMLNDLHLDVDVRGYFILLPTGFPFLGGRLNLCRYSPKLSFGLADSRLRYLGEKHIYICRKRTA
jgi:ubiquinone/menaquinone biosynthesis C-methylase UbiE